MRTKGSCRFEAYYKIEKWDGRFCVWMPIQKPFPTYQDADANRPEGKTRIMEVTQSGFKEATQ